MNCDCEFLPNREPVVQKRGLGSSHPLYKTWAGIKARCYCKGAGNYKYYGEKGVRMSRDWFHSFDSFVRDMGSKTGPGMSIDRTDGKKGYCKHNCKWATKTQQAINLTKYKTSKYGIGVTLTTNRLEFYSKISIAGKLTIIGRYKTAKEAQEAYYEKHIEIHGVPSPMQIKESA